MIFARLVSMLTTCLCHFVSAVSLVDYFFTSVSFHLCIFSFSHFAVLHVLVRVHYRPAFVCISYIMGVASWRRL
jgi:hypothetical protein